MQLMGCFLLLQIQPIVTSESRIIVEEVVKQCADFSSISDESASSSINDSASSTLFIQTSSDSNAQLLWITEQLDELNITILDDTRLTEMYMENLLLSAGDAVFAVGIVANIITENLGNIIQLDSICMEEILYNGLSTLAPSNFEVLVFDTSLCNDNYLGCAFHEKSWRYLLQDGETICSANIDCNQKGYDSLEDCQRMCEGR
eukprot:TRINITY_DN9052_c0_g1_i13.p2 TRINITY_DN9052_c0_g1~~TRINITY_DN9052_c0_g1_i13.p2  ORF type:complete len:203 (-),score=0.69 TRINITY_DN9052_c0_g1_i13:85-693(-)